jgi:PadR family transcriptional regulator, regulatory protein PadR
MARESLTDFELMTLLAILRVGDCAYGVPIARELETTGGRSVALASVYVVLGRLEERGLVTSRVSDPTPERGGRAKKFFCVSPKGMAAVREAQRALVALWHGLPALKKGGLE